MAEGPRDESDTRVTHLADDRDRLEKRVELLAYAAREDSGTIGPRSA